MSSMLDYFYSIKDTSVQNTDTIHTVNIILQRLERSAQVHKKNLSSDEEKYRIYGELLTSFGHTIKHSSKEAVILNYYTDENVSVKIVKLIQSYTGVVNKMVWRK